MSRKVVITAMGVCSSLGFSEAEIIDSLENGRVSFERPSFDPTVVTSPVRNFDIRDFFHGPFKDRRYLTRGGLFCVASAMAAVRDSGLGKEMLTRAGLFMGTGPNLDISGEFPEIPDRRMDRDDLMALWMLRFLPNTPASVTARCAGIHGENLTINTACAASLQAVGEAFRKIREGYLDLAFAGGGDSRLNPGGILAYRKANALFTETADPGSASRPFDRGRCGFVPGEGGAVFLLESLAHAKSRGASVYAEVCGYGSSMDGYNMTAPYPEAEWGEKAVREALHDAGMDAGDIDLVSAHGTGTPLNDDMEAVLLDRVFGNTRPRVTAFKSWTGHLAAACGAIELALTLVCMRHRYIPQIRNLQDPCHPRINFVRNVTEDTPDAVLLENFGFGGQNTALVINRYG